MASDTRLLLLSCHVVFTPRRGCLIAIILSHSAPACVSLAPMFYLESPLSYILCTLSLWLPRPLRLMSPISELSFDGELSRLALCAGTNGSLQRRTCECWDAEHNIGRTSIDSRSMPLMVQTMRPPSAFPRQSMMIWCVDPMHRAHLHMLTPSS